MGEIETAEHDRRAAAQHDVGGFGIEGDVELGRGGDVAEGPATHDRDPRDPLRQGRISLQRRRDVGERAGRHDPHARVLAGRLDEEPGRVVGADRSVQLGKRRAREAGLAVHVPGMVERVAVERPAAPECTSTSMPSSCTSASAFAGRVFEPDVARHRGDAEQPAPVRRDRERDRIVMARIAVEDHIEHHAAQSGPISARRALRRASDRVDGLVQRACGSARSRAEKTAKRKASHV